LRVTVQFLLRSRETKANKCGKLKQELDEAQRLLARREAELERQGEEIRELKQQMQRLEIENRIQAQSTSLSLPDDPPIGTHGYGARMVSLAVNLARTVGFRGTQRSLEIVFDWLGVQQDIPHFATIRNWVQRVGLAALNEPIERADDWVWMVDHSNQIGPEKVLIVLGIRASQMPPPGTTVKHEDVRLLAVRPGTTWKREDMAAVYTELAKQCGPPRAVLADGAVELRDGAECLKKQRSDTIVLQDFKHKAAIFLKASIGKGERFAEFNTLLGRTRSAIQQTELAHLTPPSLKHKARFMNLAAILDWAATILWLLDHPEAEARKLVTPERLEDKLGWLRSFADDLAVWRECQQVIKQGIKFINKQGLFRGAAEQLRAAVGLGLAHATSRQLADRLIDFVADAERDLKRGERLPMSTEILESSFGLFKQLERQHSKGGFTSLLAGFGTLLKKATRETVQHALSTVSVNDVKQWVRENLGETLTSKRIATYKEFQHATQGATKLTATT
jgi:hypothetical protein